MISSGIGQQWIVPFGPLIGVAKSTRMSSAPLQNDRLTQASQAFLFSVMRFYCTLYALRNLGLSSDRKVCCTD